MCASFFVPTVQLNVGGIAISFVGIVTNLTFSVPLDVGDGLSAALRAHPFPDISSTGAVILVSLVLPTMRDSAEYNVTMASGLHVGNGEYDLHL